MTDFRSKLFSALQVDIPYTERPALKPGLKNAAVLALFGTSKKEHHIFVTQRTDQVETHKGQMAFPGGVHELNESDEEAALRETEEEAGISRTSLEVVGKLPDFATPTGFRIVPIVGILNVDIEKVELKMNTIEIAAAFWAPLSELKKVYRKESITVGPVKYPIHVFQLGEYRIWGATGLMIKNLLDRLDHLG